MPSSIKDLAKLIEGKNTESTADQAEIKKLFPNTYGMPFIIFEQSNLSQKVFQLMLELSLVEVKTQVDTMLLMVFLMELNQ